MKINFQRISTPIEINTPFRVDDSKEVLINKFEYYGCTLIEIQDLVGKYVFRYRVGDEKKITQTIIYKNDLK